MRIEKLQKFARSLQAEILAQMDLGNNVDKLRDELRNLDKAIRAERRKASESRLAKAGKLFLSGLKKLNG